MTDLPVVALAAGARSSVEQAVKLLRDPDPAALEECESLLRTAVIALSQITPKDVQAELRPILSGLQRDVSRVALLMRHAWEFYTGCMRAGFSTEETLRPERYDLESYDREGASAAPLIGVLANWAIEG